MPGEFGLIDLDRQVDALMERAEALLGSSSRETLGKPATIDRMVERFMLNAQIRAGITSGSARGSIALSLLQAGGLGAGAQANLFTSNFV